MQKPILVLIICLLFCSEFFAQNSGLDIIPQPKSVTKIEGEFKFNKRTQIVVFDEIGRKTAGILNDLVMQYYGFKLEYTEKPINNNAIIFLSQDSLPKQITREGYGLTITPKIIRISGKKTGQFYAVQTLLQILPTEYKGETKLPAVDILDEPRFVYRGMHLDVGRHFMPISFIKKYIDLMSQYKLNTFHWHLTDDQGWRIEIKKYPKLTEIGSKRKESQQGPYTTTFRGDGIPIEGFYTQDQIREVVAFAQQRHITVIPEIELPGHSSAALMAYPELGCKQNYEYKVQQTWGIFKEVFCPTEKTFQFFEEVLTETIALFPDSPYIHIGGDEVLKDHWKESPEVQALMKRENLKDEHEVQSYFVRRMEKFINSKGKKIIGWDEILEGGLAPNATVMSWRGEKGGIEAAKSKHDVIMTPTNFLYFDYGQGDPAFEPINIGNFLPLETVYAYNPLPKELTPEQTKYVLGAQANVWTEYMKTPEKVEYMVFPRMLALAEVVWSPLEGKNYADFQKRLENQFPRLDKQNVNYRIPAPIGLQNRVITDNSKQIIALKPIINNAKIFYTLDGSEPTDNSNLYKKPLIIGLDENQKIELKTVVVLPNRRKSVTYAATLMRRPYLEPIEKITSKNSYVNFSYFKSSFKSVIEMDGGEPTEKGRTQSIQLPQFAKKQDLKQPFGVIFSGLIEVPNDGIYEFQLESDDGAVLLIGEQTIVENDGTHLFQTKTGIAPLRKGFHRIKLKYFNTGGDSALNLRWGIKGTGLRRIYGNELYNEEQ